MEPSKISEASSAARQAGGAREVRLLLATGRQPMGLVVAGAAAGHAVLLLLLLSLAWLRPMPTTPAPLAVAVSEPLVWVVEGTPGGGSGGGGDQIPEPPRRAPALAVRPPDPAPVVDPPDERLNEPLEPLAGARLPLTPTSAPVALPGVSDVAGRSRGEGSQAGAGRGDEAGIGDRGGDMLGSADDDGAGNESGSGEGFARPPTLLYSPSPRYTARAMLRHVEGEVHLECLSLATGSVGECRVVQSVDRNAYGLDDAALQTAERFRFVPATRGGKPVATPVRIVLAFRIQ